MELFKDKGFLEKASHDQWLKIYYSTEKTISASAQAFKCSPAAPGYQEFPMTGRWNSKWLIYLGIREGEFHKRNGFIKNSVNYSNR